MNGPELVGICAPSQSRRWFLGLGGGFLGLMLVPGFARAARKATAPSLKKTTGGAGSYKSSAKPSAGTATAKPAGRPKAAKDSRRAAAGESAGRSTKAKAKASRRGGKLRKRSGREAEVARAEPPVVLESPPAVIAPPGLTPGCRSLALYHLHTGESAMVDYFVDGEYDPDGLKEIDRVLRDYHTDEVCPIDPHLLNQLHEVWAALGSGQAFTVFSGYRSPETNALYRRMGAHVAEHSYHLKGQAIDVALPGRDLRQVRNVALAMQAGGVGYYPWNGFVHLDSGPIRRW